MSQVRRRSAALLAIVATTPIWLAACGSDDAATTDAPDTAVTDAESTETDSGEPTSETADSTSTDTVTTDAPVDEADAAESTPESAADAGERTIEHKFGTTAIEGVPERIVTIGLTDQDYVIALGFAPVGTSEWFGEQPGALFPWAREALGDQPMPEAVLDIYEPDPEEIAALRPDLILAINSGLTQEQYELLDEIAPTVAQPGEFPDYGAPWQEITQRTEDQLNGHPIYSQLDFVESGNTVPLLELSRANTAMSFGSVLSLPVAIEEMVPRLVAAVDGDPATEVAPTEVTAE